jgi:hypothetical protein
MKARRNIYYIIGAILILFNLLADLIAHREFFANIEANGFSFGYLIGAHILMIFGFVFLRLGFKLNKKIKLNNSFDIDKSIESIGKQ